MGVDYRTQLGEAVAHGDLVRPVTLLALSYINILNVHAVSGVFAHPICYHWYLDDRSLKMSSEFSEWFRINAVRSILYSDAS